jgi:hypothetical protein
MCLSSRTFLCLSSRVVQLGKTFTIGNLDQKSVGTIQIGVQKLKKTEQHFFDSVYIPDDLVTRSPLTLVVGFIHCVGKSYRFRLPIMWKRALQMTVKEAKRSVICEEERQIQGMSDEEDKSQIIQ